MAHRRRGVGVGRSAGPAFSKKAQELKDTSVASALETVETLQEKLQVLAQTHQQSIQNDPAFRHAFLQLCGPLGVDPFVSSKSFWSKALGVGMGDFYYELAIQVYEVCASTRSQNGGILPLSEVHQMLVEQQRRQQQQKSRKAQDKNKNNNQIKRQDIVLAIQKLSVLGGGFRIMTIGKTDMVVSVPMELDQDHVQILEVAQSADGGHGCLTLHDVTTKLSWSTERAERGVLLLLQQGMAWQDDYMGITFYWFPSLWKEASDFLQ